MSTLSHHNFFFASAVFCLLCSPMSFLLPFQSCVCSQPPNLFYHSSLVSTLSHQIFSAVPVWCLFSATKAFLPFQSCVYPQPPKLFYRSNPMSALNHHTIEPH
ncbi:hypothetical protein AVEN_35274-1 [Araneus ventricosus]|uniref:Secreted protein n=1 Tax=Araneus ventricosus TaxID=182803 RepID=A0A4Y2EFQ0_ARAVE|nr:hypothetical protein AVEN_35274-1 [Araneus ventricosus]